MPNGLNRNLVNQIQQANDISEVISEHINLTKKGKEMVGLCPFHDDHRPSLYVNSLKQIFKCFACGAGGDVFKFIQMRENLSFPQAIERLGERVGIKVTRPKASGKSTKDRTAEIDPNKLAWVNNWAAKQFQQNLQDKQKGKSARDYLYKRQFTDKTIDSWRLGLAFTGDDLLTKAKGRKIPPEMLVAAGLVIRKAPEKLGDKFTNRLMFSITDITGRVVGFGGRSLDEQVGPKYLNSPASGLFDKSNCLYGLQQARHEIVKTGTAIVVEGYTDCIMAHQLGCENVVATLGTSLTAGHAQILKRFAKQIVLMFDNDAAGAAAANRALDICLGQRIDIKLAFVPEGKDPCDFLLAAGREKFEQLTQNAIDVFEFKWNRLKQSFTKDNLVDNKAALEEFLNTIATALKSGSLPAIEGGLIINRLSGIIGLNSKQINSELRKRITRAQRLASYTSQNQEAAAPDTGNGLFAAAQREILEVLLNEPILFEAVKDKITAEDFDVPILSRIAAVVFDTLEVEPQAGIAEILAQVELPSVSRLIVQMAEAGEEKKNYKKRMADALNVINKGKKQRTITEIKTIKDQKQFLQQAHEGAARENRHNIGMT